MKEVARLDGCVTNVRRGCDVQWRIEHLEIESQSHAHVRAIYKSGYPVRFVGLN